MKKKYLIYIGLMLLILITPLAGMAVRPTNGTTENKELSRFPSLRGEEGWNRDYLSDLGTYFEEHFAFRQELVSANSELRSKLVKTSSEKKVVLGQNGWLYYSGTTGDYQGTRLLSERSLFNTAHNLAMMQGMTEALGSGFYYTISPNKNTLYGENMPYYYQKGKDSNLNSLIPYLEEEGVHYIDVKGAFEKEKEVLYLKRDSHWNNKGAVLAYNTMLDTLGKEHEDYLNIPYTKERNYLGDLNTMLYPLTARPEVNYEYQREQKYHILSEVKDVEADWIEAENPEKTGSVLMFRDSFGNTLFPLFANEFNKTYFSKLTPYNMADIVKYKPDYVIVERVERRISSIIEQPPIMQGPTVKIGTPEQVKTNTSIRTRKNGPYLMIEGIIDPQYIETRSRVFIVVHPSGEQEKNAYEAFGIQIQEEDGQVNDGGYQLYLKEKNMPSDTDYDIEVIVSGEKGMFTVLKKTYSKNKD